MLMWLLQSLFIILMGLGAVAFVTLLERKLLGLSQVRLGPNKVIYFGILQPVADGIKLLFKDTLNILSSQSSIYMLSPFFLLILFFILWTWLLPWEGNMTSLKYSSLIFFSLLGLGTYAIILTGWSSTSNFSKLGSLRGMLQSLAFEVAFILLFLTILSMFKGFLMKSEEPLSWEVTFMMVLGWLLLSLMETNRAPFDLLEGESELISGFNVEMGSLYFVYLFLSEYGMIMVLMFICGLIMFGKIVFLSLAFISVLLFIRSCFPRVRYDIMMSMMWQSILPLSIFSFLLVIFMFYKM